MLNLVLLMVVFFLFGFVERAIVLTVATFYQDKMLFSSWH